MDVAFLFLICKRLFPHILNKARVGRTKVLPTRASYYDAQKYLA